MYSNSDTGLPTERNKAGGIAPQEGIEFTSAETFLAGPGIRNITFNTNGNVVSHWKITVGTTVGGVESAQSSVFTGATLDGSGPVDAETNAFTGTYAWIEAGVDTYYARLYYKYGANNTIYKTLDQTITLT